MSLVRLGLLRKHQVKWTILNYAETSYKQYTANPARRLTRLEEAKYTRNMNKYDDAIKCLYKCRCHEEAKIRYETLEGRSESELREILKNAHPDKRDGREDLRKEFEDALRELRRQKTNGPQMTRRCGRCEMKRQLAEQYLSNVESVLRNAPSPLKPEDFISSIHYKPCFRTVIRSDLERYGDGDLTLFDDIRRLSNL